jgi:hypothetical protein
MEGDGSSSRNVGATGEEKRCPREGFRFEQKDGFLDRQAN